MNENKSKKWIENKWLDALALISIISFELVLCTGIGLWSGLFLHQKLNLPTFVYIITTLFGFGIGLIWVMRLLKNYDKKNIEKRE